MATNIPMQLLSQTTKAPRPACAVVSLCIMSLCLTFYREGASANQNEPGHQACDMMCHHAENKVFSGDFLAFINFLERLEVHLFSAVDGKNAFLGCMGFLAAVPGVATGKKNQLNIQL